MSELERIADQMRRMYDGAWHGPSISQSLDGISAQQAAARPVPHGHSIFELVHHITAWMGEGRQRLLGRPAGDPDEGNFPSAGTNVDDGTWRDLLEHLEGAHNALIETTTRLDPERLDLPLYPSDDEPGKVFTPYQLLHGLIQHNAYHAGQIMMLRRAQGV